MTMPTSAKEKLQLNIRRGQRGSTCRSTSAGNVARNFVWIQKKKSSSAKIAGLFFPWMNTECFLHLKKTGCNAKMRQRPLQFPNTTNGKGNALRHRFKTEGILLPRKCVLKLFPIQRILLR